MSVSRLVHWFRTGGHARPADPPVELNLRRAIPVWAVRLLLAGLATGVVALNASSRGRWIVGLAVVAAIAWRPGGGGAMALVLLAAFWTLVGDPFPDFLPWLLLGVHLSIVVAGIVGNLPLRALVEVGVFRRPLARLAAIQVFSQLVLAAARAVSGQEVSMVWFQATGAACILFLAWAAIVRLRSMDID